MIKFRSSWACLGVLVFGCSACDSPEVGAVLDQAQSLWGSFTGQPAPAAKPSAVPSSPSTEGSISEGGFSSVAARNAKANSELFHEMFSVVFMREPKDRSEFGIWVDTLNQGASLEGVHNGLVKSADYRNLESKGTASVEALKVFSEELAELELELPTPTVFDPLSAAPSPTVSPSPSPLHEHAEAPVPVLLPPHEVSARALTEQYKHLFVGGSIYLLKRTLADEALRVIASKGEFKEKRALWYSKWVVHMTARHVDFGVSLRNKPDEAFHYKWAIEAAADRLSWEVLNRLHRVLNEANREKQ
jgi:hypothetical protein